MLSILLIDGDPLRAMQRAELLERSFPAVQRVATAAEALCLIEQPQFARGLRLVVSGTPLSGIDAPSLVRELRQRVPQAAILVLAGPEAGTVHDAGHAVRVLGSNCTGEQMISQAEILLKDRAI